MVTAPAGCESEHQDTAHEEAVVEEQIGHASDKKMLQQVLVVVVEWGKEERDDADETERVYSRQVLA